MTSTSLISKPSALSLIAAASRQEPARTPQMAVAHTIALISGTYGARFQPSENSALAWMVVLGDATAEEIAAATLAHVTDTSRDGDGKMRGEFPPSAVELLAGVRAARRRIAEKEQELADARESAVRFFERGDLAAMKSKPSWNRLRQDERQAFENRHETGRKIVEERNGQHP